MKILRIFFLLFVVFSFNTTYSQPEQQFADLGDFVLQSGEVIEDCQIGYRTFGKLNGDSSNVILFSTWFGGKSEHLGSLIGPGKLIDSTHYFVIAVDALGNGVSSSPSNSPTQQDGKFPVFTISDMVTTQYSLVTQDLGFSRLFAVIGGSMGGMQTFQWIVQYPEFMEKAVPYVGSPQMTSSDLLLWNMELKAIEAAHDGGCDTAAMMRLVGSIQNFAIRTPQYIAEHISREDFPEYYRRVQSGVSDNHDSFNWAGQLRAMIAHDVAKPFQGSLKAAARLVQAELLIIVGKQDHMVNPAPAIKFAGLTKAEKLILDSNCGHLAVNCEMDTVVKRIAGFLDS